MARLSSEITFIGSLGNVSAYKMKGMDKIIVRMKGGASKEMIKSSPAFALPRRYMFEFGGRSTASKLIMRMLWPQKPLADYNIAGLLNGLMKPVQQFDDTSALGKRNIELSKCPWILNGFPLNRQTPFESIVRTSLNCSVSRESLSAHVEIPALLPGINFIPPKRYAMYSFIATLGVVPDLFYHEAKYRPSHPDYDNFVSKRINSDWFTVKKGSAANSLDLALNAIPPDNAFTLVLSIGIRFGSLVDGDIVEQEKNVGAAKILATA
jgi:hypothetical protein